VVQSLAGDCVLYCNQGSQLWSSASSSLLQVIVSIQGLILNTEPYYNEAGFEKQRDSQAGLENSRLYNEMVLVKLVQVIRNHIWFRYE